MIREIFPPRFCKLTAAHANAMSKLETLCFSLPWSLRQCESAFGQPNFSAFGLLSGRFLFAYLSFYHVQDEMEIVNLAVHPARRRKGNGKILLRLAMTQASSMGIQKVFLEVRQGNSPAIQLYEKIGFRQCGRRKGYYPDNGEDALLYVKELL